MAYLYLRHEGSQPLTLSELAIDGRVEADAIWPPDPQRRAHWHEIVPQQLQPGQIAQVRLSLRQTGVAQPFTLSVTTTCGETLTHAFSGKQEALEFSDLAVSADHRAISFFVQGETGTLHRVWWDGLDVTAACDLRGGRFFHGVAFGLLPLSLPATPGSYHLLEVETDTGAFAITRMRILPDKFLLGTYGVADKASFEDYQAHGLNHYLAFGDLNQERMAELAQLGMTGGSQPARSGVFKAGAFVPIDHAGMEARIGSIRESPAVAYYSLPDEPDIWDYRAGQSGAHGRAMIALYHTYGALDPSRPVFVQIDNTYRSSNLHIYAPAADYVASHSYLLGRHFLNEDRVAMREVIRSARPHRLVWVTQFYPLKAKQGERVAYNGRLPHPDEMALQMFSALATGAKGIIHYMHSGSQGGGGGAGRDKALWDALTPLHHQFAAVGPLAVRATPVPWAQSHTPGVEAWALLADHENLLLVVINGRFESRNDGFSIQNVENARLSVVLPEWFMTGKVREVLSGGTLRESAFQREAETLTMEVADLTTGALFWFSASDA